MKLDQSELERFKLRHPRDVDLNLDRIQRLLQDLNNPQYALPPTIHVAGTNGKGSTIAFLRACLEAEGYRVHTYTSPHLVHFNERIRLAGTLVSDAELESLLSTVLSANKDRPLTFFEATTAAAFLGFADHPADILLLETGLGGRLDATNVINNPLATVLTPISYDHQEFLGNTLAAIAHEKAAIIKPGAVAIIGPQSPEVLPVLTAAIAANGACGYFHGRNWSYDNGDDGMTVRIDDTQITRLQPSLGGHHQLTNAATAIACLHYVRQQFPIRETSLREGVHNAVWPGRLQQLSSGPLVAALRPGQELWLDGAHNADGLKALASVVDSWVASDIEVHLALALLKNRDPALFVPLLSQIVGKTILLEMEEGDRFHSAADLVRYFREHIKDFSFAIQPISQFLQGGENIFQSPSRILCTGSLYLVGAVLEMNQTLPR